MPPFRSKPTRSASRSSLLFAALLVAALAAPHTLDAQVLYGSLGGTVTDPTDALFPGATVEATNVGTNVTRSATTDQRGAFLFTDLQPGVYNVTVSAPSFGTALRKSVEVATNALRRVNVQLQVASATETVEVTATAAALQADRADLHITQTARQVNDLPLTGGAGRNYQSLMQVVPGAVLAVSGGTPLGEQNSTAGSPQRSISFNVNGVSRMQNNTRLDGASVIYPWLPTNTAYVPSPEAIEEVSIVTNSYNAEQGIAGGAAINVVMKSGTNALRGTAWGYASDFSWRARNKFLAATAAKPDGHLNQFGANLGGPIVKNKVFFFANWERTERLNIAPVRRFSIATEAMRRGDFSGTGTIIYNPFGPDGTLVDPAQRQPFANNQIPASLIDSAAAQMAALLPAPNAGTGVSENYQAQGQEEYTRDNVDFKLTFHPRDDLSLFARYSYSPHNVFDPPALGEAGGDALAGGQLGNAPGKTHVAGLGGTYTFASNLLLDFNAGFTRQVLGAEATDIETNVGLDVLGIPGTNGPDRLQGGTPSFQTTGWANMGNPNTGNPFQFRDNQFVANANLSWFRGAHALRFGYEHVNQQLNHFQPQGGDVPDRARDLRVQRQHDGEAGRHVRPPSSTVGRTSSWGCRSAPGRSTSSSTRTPSNAKTHALYAQDQWQVTRKLTLTAGLRWEYYPWPTPRRDGGLALRPDRWKRVHRWVGDVPQDTGASVGGHFLPRAGLAYRIGEKTVVRAGYGRSADPVPYIEFRNSFPINFVWEYPAPVFNAVQNNFLPVASLTGNIPGLRQGLVEPTRPNLNQGIVPLPTSAGTSTFPKDEQREYIDSFNVAIQRELSPA